VTEESERELASQSPPVLLWVPVSRSPQVLPSVLVWQWAPVLVSQLAEVLRSVLVLACVLVLATRSAPELAYVLVWAMQSAPESACVLVWAMRSVPGLALATRSALGSQWA
jgi:hypothetical protein